MTESLTVTGVKESRPCAGCFRVCGVRLPWSSYTSTNALRVVYEAESGMRMGRFELLYQVYSMGAISGPVRQVHNMEGADARGGKVERVFPLNSYQRYYGVHRSHVIIREFPFDTIEATAAFSVLCYNITAFDGPIMAAQTLLSIITYKHSKRRTYTYKRSSGPVALFKVQVKEHLCGETTSMKLSYARIPRYKMREREILSTFDPPVSYTQQLRDCQHKNMKICIFYFRQIEEETLNVTVSRLSLPGLDLSHGCLYEGLAVYEYKRWYRGSCSSLDIPLEMASPKLNLCTNITKGETAGEEYSSASLFTSTDPLYKCQQGRLLVVFYSYHPYSSYGEVEFTVSRSHCPAFTTHCDITIDSQYYSSRSTARRRYWVGSVKVPGWPRKGGVQWSSGNSAIGYRQNHTMSLNLLSTTSCAILQQFPSRDVYHSLKRCVVAVFQGSDQGGDSLKLDLWPSRNYCKEQLNFEDFTLEHIGIGSLLAGNRRRLISAHAITQGLPTCHSFVLKASVVPTAGLISFAHKSIDAMLISNLFLNPKKSSAIPYAANLSFAVPITGKEIANNKHYGVAHFRVELADLVHDHDMFFAVANRLQTGKTSPFGQKPALQRY